MNAPQNHSATAAQPWYVSTRLHLLVLAVFFAVLYMPCLGMGSLAAFDEGTYAEVARQCLRGHWVVLHHGPGPWNTDKPPLMIWVQAISMALFGETEFGVRFPVALCGIALVLMTYALGRRMFGALGGLLAGLLVGLSPHVSGFALSGMHDVPLAACTTAAMLCGYIGFIEKRPIFQTWMLILVGVGVMVKSVSGLLPVFAIGLWIALFWQWKRLAWRAVPGWPLGPIPMGFLGAVLIVAPWHVAFAIALPHDFWYLYLGFTIKQRLIEGFYVLGDFPYLQTLININGANPLLPLGFVGLIWLLGRLFAKRDLSNAYLFLWLGVFTAVVLLSRTQSHHYAMPIYPALALTAAGLLDAFIRDPRRHAGLVVLGTGLTFAAWPMLHDQPSPSALVNGLLLAGLLAALATWSGRARRLGKGPWMERVAVGLLVLAPIGYCVHLFWPPDGSEGVKELAVETQDLLTEDDRLAAYDVTYLTPVFYFDRPVTWVLKRSEILKDWLLAENKAYVIVDQRGLEDIGAGNYTLIAQAKDRALITNPEGRGEEPAVYPVEFELHPNGTGIYQLDSRGRITFSNGSVSDPVVRTDERAVDLEIVPDPTSLIVMTNRGRFITVRGSVTLPDMPLGDVEYVDFEFSLRGGYLVLDRSGRVMAMDGAAHYGHEEGIWGEIPVDLEFNPKGDGYLILYSYGTVRGFGADTSPLKQDAFGWDAMADMTRSADGHAVRLDRFGGLHGVAAGVLSPYYGPETRHRSIQIGADGTYQLMADGLGVFPAQTR